jgi:hypothetical protein
VHRARRLFGGSEGVREPVIWARVRSAGLRYNGGVKARRVIVVVLLIIVYLGWSIADLRRVFMPLGEYGFASSDGIVTRLDAGGPAARAGIRLGDRLIGSIGTPLARYALVRGVAASAGRSLELQVADRGKSRRITLVAEPEPLPIRAFVALRFLLAFLTIGVATALLLTRPAPAAWGFFLYCLTVITLPGAVLGFYVPWWVREATGVLPFLVQSAGYAGAVLFALTFAGQSLRSWLGAVFGVVTFAAALDAAAQIQYLFNPAWEARANTIDDICVAFVLAGMFVGFVHSYAHDTGAARQRLRWIIAALLISVPARYTASWLFPSYLTYGQYVALVYAVLTAALVAVFSLLDATFSRAFEQSRLGFGVDITAALVLGFLLNAAHHRVDNVIERVLFRERHRAEIQLEHGASGLLHATKNEAITETLLQLPVHALSLTGSALYLRSDLGFLRSGATGALEYLPTSVDLNDALALCLYARGKPVRPDDVPLSKIHAIPAHDSAVLAVPLSAHGTLTGFAVYGAHRNGADIDADEQSALAPLGVNAAIAFAYVEAQRLRARISELEGGLAYR